MIKTKKISEGIKNKVYDISLDGTFVNGLGMNVLHNTDGLDFAIPDKLRYTKENPYIGKGRNRDTKEGKEYIGVEGDVAEFDDMFLDKVYHNGINKMGLGIDEFVKSSINIKRKNYLCWMEEDDSIKKVGNTVKSRKMPGYLQNFFNKECQILIRGDGYTFLKDYYDYIDDIYNYRIPVKDIASRGKFKKSIKEYNEDCNTLTKAGNKKSRLAWYELAIQNGMSMDMGETLYYINTGKKKSESDVKRVTHKYLEDGTEVTGRVI